MDSKEQRLVVDCYIAAYNAFDIQRMMTMIHQDIEFKSFSGGKVNAVASGEREFRQLAEQSKELFSSRNQTVKAFESHEDRAGVEVEYEAVLAVDLPNGMNAGETLRLDGRSEFEFRDGLIYRLADFS